VTSGFAPAGGTLSLDAWYSYLGPRDPGVQARLKDGPTLWIGGESTSTTLFLGPGGRSWHADLTPGVPPRQETSDAGPGPALPPWNRPAGTRWLWLEIGPDRQAAVDDPPLLEVDLPAGSQAPGRVLARGSPAVVLPLLAEPAPPPVVSDGTLVKGSGEDVFYVDGGKLRWVSGVDVLERRGIAWRLRSLDDGDLWRLPVDLPLT
jgi:hypothetical protein